MKNKHLLIPIRIEEPKEMSRSGNLHNFVKDFIRNSDVKEKTRNDYRKALKRFESWVEVNSIFSPQKADILNYKTYLEKESLSSLTISFYLVALRQFFSHLEGIKAYPNVAQGVKGMKQPDGFLRDSLTKQQVKRLLETAKKEGIKAIRDYAIINLILRTGMRTIEVIRADIGDIGKEGNQTVLRIQGKGRDSKDRIAFLTSKTYNPILDYLKLRGKTEGKEPLFVSISHRNSNQRLTTRTIRGIAQKNIEEAGFKTSRLTTHSFRHTRATDSLEQGAELISVQEMLGHKDIRTTMRYVHTANRLKNAAEKYCSF